MKICAIADLHGKYIDIPKCDVLIIAGDITYGINWDYGYEWFKSMFIPYLKDNEDKYKICFLVFGNHDDVIYMDRDIEDTDKIKILTNKAYTYEGIKFYGSPNCKYICGFQNTYTEDVLKEIYSKIPKDIDILITHSPPYGIGDKSIDKPNHFGSVSLLEKIREIEPRTHIFGHVHTGTRYTRENGIDFFNVSILNEDYKLTYKPTIINIEE